MFKYRISFNELENEWCLYKIEKNNKDNFIKFLSVKEIKNLSASGKLKRVGLQIGYYLEEEP